ncbi:group I truncated hemoglobin [Silanimonas lenta]|uniref:group I truncated hemoglobin n=1 Tax=Silanimonas lenta TaxID=265429 RepID=UPI0003FF0D4E|nr:group 1 truncated hemoglobin [Silanimonas lenta]
MSRYSSATERSLRAALLALLLAGCASTGAPKASLYERLGGAEGIDAISFDLLARSVADPRIAEDFVEADLVNLHERLVERLCALSGGPCTYGGRDMRAAHAGLGLTEADFNALVEHLVDAMRARGVPLSAQNELLAILAPMRREVIRQ